MSHEAALVAILNPVVNNAVYPDTFPQSDEVPVWPAIRYTYISGTTYQSLCGNGDPDTDDPRIQLDGVANTARERNQLSLDIQDAMNEMDPPAVLQGTPETSFDTETKTYRVTLDYVLHASS